jgi:hypothetical protein
MIKSTLILITVIVLGTSCNRYYNVAVNGNVPKNENKELIYENDTIKVVFSFVNSLHKPILQFEVFNKLETPLFVDWKNTLLNYNNNNYSYYDNSSSVQLTRSSSNKNDFAGNIRTDNATEIILPKTSIRSKGITYLKKINLKDKQFKNIDKNSPANYNSSNSPNTFRLFITTSTNKNFTINNYTDCNFWVEQIKYDPKHKIEEGGKGKVDKTSFIYKYKPTSRKVVNGVLGLTLMTGLILIVSGG